MGGVCEGLAARRSFWRRCTLLRKHDSKASRYSACLEEIHPFSFNELMASRNQVNRFLPTLTPTSKAEDVTHRSSEVCFRPLRWCDWRLPRCTGGRTLFSSQRLYGMVCGLSVAADGSSNEALGGGTWGWVRWYECFERGDAIIKSRAIVEVGWPNEVPGSG